MTKQEDKYISLLTDFGFKRIFGTAVNKDLLISFLNTLFDGEQVIRDLYYLDGEKGDWDYRLEHVYVVAILNFYMHEPAFDEAQVQHTVQLCDTETGCVFYKKLTLKYVELAKFDKTEDELHTMRDKWFFVLKNLQRLQRQPASLQERVFQHLFEQASIARFEPGERQDYERSISAYRDIKNSVNTAKDEGRNERSTEIAKNLLALGIDTAKVAQATGLDEATLKGMIQ